MKRLFSRKTLSCLLTLALAIGLIPVWNVFSYADTLYDSESGLCYLVDGQEVTIVRNPEGDSRESIIIPESIEGMPVTTIDSYAFSGCRNLKNVEMPNSVTSIGNSAFNFCLYLTNITFSDSLINIGDLAFFECHSLKEVNFPSSLKNIGNEIFMGCSGLQNINVETENENYSSKDGVLFDEYLKEIIRYPAGKTDTSYEIPNSVTSIANNAFGESHRLTSIFIPDSVTGIGESAFANCSALSTIGIPKGITKIESWTFSGCTGLNTITIPDSVISIGESAFYDCSNLTTIYYSGRKSEWDHIEIAQDNSILLYVEIECDPLDYIVQEDGTIKIIYFDYDINNDETDVVIPEKIDGKVVTCIGSNAFSSYKTLTSVTIPDTVTSIESSAFEGCYSLKDVIIPDSVTSIGPYAFLGCSSLTRVTIPDGVTSIGPYTFSGCKNLTSVIIPDGVTNIGPYTFGGCENLTSVTIPDGVMNIESGVFNGCGSLTSVTIPNSVTFIGEYAFYGCDSLTNVTIPDSVEFIYYRAFEGCSSLTSVTISDSVGEIKSYVFSNCSSLASVIIPDSVMSIEDHAFYNCSSLTSVSIPDSVTNIGSYAFSNCSSLTSVRVPDSVTSIGTYAFSACSSLANVSIPDSVTNIGTYAFSACSSLTSVIIPDSVTSIVDYTFYDCSSLTSVIISDGVKNIGNRAFSDCSNLTSVTIPDSVTNIGHRAFDKCSSLTSMIISDNVTSIGQAVFSGCSGLTQIEVNPNNKSYQSNNGVLFDKQMTEIICYPAGAETEYKIPDSVTKIGLGAFEGCKSLKSVSIPDSVTRIEWDAFDGCSSLANVYYSGNEDAWNAISIEEGNDALTNANIHFNSTGPETPEQYTVSVSSEGKGSVSGSGTFEEGSTVTVTATPEANQSFLGWYKGNELVSEATEYTFTIEIDTILVGKFTLNEPVVQPEEYEVSLSSEGKGTVSGSGTFEEGSSITVKAIPEENQDFLGWYKGNELVSEAAEYTFTIEADTILVGKFTSNESGENTINPFTDVSAESYYYKPVLWAVENKITSGTSDTTFSPEDSCTRAQMVTFMWRAKGCPEPASTSNPFTDVKEDAYYYKAVLWAAEQKITTGTSDTTFSPEATVNRAQSVTFLWRMEGSEVVAANNPFTDVSTGAYYYNAVLWAVKNGVTTGKSKTSFAPDDPCIRAQIVTFLYRDMV